MGLPIPIGVFLFLDSVQNAPENNQCGGNDKWLIDLVDGQFQFPHLSDCICSRNHFSGCQILTVPNPEDVMLCAEDVQADACNPDEPDCHEGVCYQFLYHHLLCTELVIHPTR